LLLHTLELHQSTNTASVVRSETVLLLYAHTHITLRHRTRAAAGELDTLIGG
jgi:hypothetical protein